MDDSTSRAAGFSRRTFLTTSAAIGVGAALGAGSVSAAPLDLGSSGLGSGTPPPPPPGCGSVNSQDFLWLAVKDAKPGNLGTNDYVVEPQPQPTTAFSQLYAIRHGGDQPKSPFDQLLLPTRRISGIECETIWQPDMLNLWKYSWTEATSILKIPEETIVVGINSKKARKLNQLHIHLSRLNNGTRTSLNGTTGLPTKLSDWTQPNALVQLSINEPGRPSAHFRVVHLDALLPNLFVELHRLVGKAAMADQMIAVAKAPKGFYVISSSGSGVHDGTGSCEGLFFM